MWSNIVQAVVGFAGGLAVAGGTFSLLVKIGVFTRLLELTRTAGHLMWLESSIVLGGIIGNFFSLFFIPFHVGVAGLLIFGTFAGMFVGWLHMALAETLSVFSIMFRRIRLKYGLGFVVMFMGLGKMAGALLYFYKGWGSGM